MSAGAANPLSASVERNLAGELAQAALQLVAPEELALFEETETEYFRNPDGYWHTKRRDETVGFGIELALLTPYVLGVGIPVVRFLATVVADALRDELHDQLEQAITAMVRRLFRRADPPGAYGPEEPEHGPAVVLTADQGREVRRIALLQARRFGLDEAQASLLADAFAGALLVNGRDQ
jgi:hypothetical protein